MSDVEQMLFPHERWVVTLDGVTQRYVEEFDTEEGWLVRIVLDKAGEPKFDMLIGDFETERLTGRVRAVKVAAE